MLNENVNQKSELCAHRGRNVRVIFIFDIQKRSGLEFCLETERFIGLNAISASASLRRSLEMHAGIAMIGLHCCLGRTTPLRWGVCLSTKSQFDGRPESHSVPLPVQRLSSTLELFSHPYPEFVTSIDFEPNRYDDVSRTPGVAFLVLTTFQPTEITETPLTIAFSDEDDDGGR